MMYDEIFKREVEAVKSLGDQIGYGKRRTINGINYVSVH